MDKRNLRLLLIYVSVILILNLFLLSSQVSLTDWGLSQNLDYSKDFANSMVSELQDFAVTLGVAERNNVKQALAKLHYDVYLVGNPTELAALIQNNAAETRALIISENVKLSGEQVLRILNNAPEVQQKSSRTVVRIEPLENGGYAAKDPNIISDETAAELAGVSSIFSFDYFRSHYQSYRNLTSLQIEIENGYAQLVNPEIDQDAINYWEREIQTIRQEYNRVSRAAGFAEVSGPGIAITISDKYHSVSALDLRRIVGELYSSGAVAIAVNGNRLGVNSYIIESDHGIEVDGYSINANPVVIEVVGDGQTLSSGVDLLFSVVMSNMFYVDIQERDLLELPAKPIQ